MHNIDTVRFPSGTSTSPTHQVPPNTPADATPYVVPPIEPSAAVPATIPRRSPPRTARSTRPAHRTKKRFTSHSDADDESDVGATDSSSEDDLPPNAKELLPHDASLSQYANLRGFVNLVIIPFFQGMFYGLGEGTAKVLLGRWFGVDPLVALGGGKQEKGRRPAGFGLGRLFGKKEAVVAPSVMESELGIVTLFQSGMLTDDTANSNCRNPWRTVVSRGKEVGLRFFTMAEDATDGILVRHNML